jgi:WG containing repeat
VRINGQFGYIDARGDVVIAPAFDLAGEFHAGLAQIRTGDKTGVIDRTGKIVVPPMFGRAIPLSREVILATEAKWESGYYAGSLNLTDTHLRGYAGLYHVDGYWILGPSLSRISRFKLDATGPIWASVRDSYGPYGLLAPDGKWLIEPQYDSAGYLNEDRAVVSKQIDGKILTGAVDGTGKLVVPLRARRLSGWHNGWSRTQEDGKQGLVDKDDNLIGGRMFDEVEPWREGDVSAVLIEGRWAGLNHAGQIVAHPREGRVTASCPNGVRVVAQDGKVQITDANGRPTVPYLFELLLSKPDCVKPFSVRFADKWGYVASDGRPLFDPPVFDNQYAFEGDYAVVQQNGKWGIIDTSGHFVQPVKFDAYKGKRDGIFQFVIDGRETWITASGEERPEPPQKYTPVPDVLNCGHGLRLFERDGKWGIADENGRDVIAPQYRALSCFLSGVAWAAIDARREWCALGPDGVVRAAPKCRTDVYLLGASHSIPEKFDEDRFENSVLWSRAYLEFHAGKRDIPPGWTSDRGMDGPVWR